MAPMSGAIWARLGVVSPSLDVLGGGHCRFHSRSLQSSHSRRSTGSYYPLPVVVVVAANMDYSDHSSGDWRTPVSAAQRISASPAREQQLERQMKKMEEFDQLGAGRTWHEHRWVVAPSAAAPEAVGGSPSSRDGASSPALSRSASSAAFSSRFSKSGRPLTPSPSFGLLFEETQNTLRPQLHRTPTHSSFQYPAPPASPWIPSSEARLPRSWVSLSPSKPSILADFGRTRTPGQAAPFRMTGGRRRSMSMSMPMCVCVCCACCMPALNASRPCPLHPRLALQPATFASSSHSATSRPPTHLSCTWTRCAASSSAPAPRGNTRAPRLQCTRGTCSRAIARALARALSH